MASLWNIVQNCRLFCCCINGKSIIQLFCTWEWRSVECWFYILRILETDRTPKVLLSICRKKQVDSNGVYASSKDVILRICAASIQTRQIIQIMKKPMTIIKSEININTYDTKIVKILYLNYQTIFNLVQILLMFR